jgi:hypothetical protein
MEKVFGIGWAKTGTTSLGRALEILGYNHVGQRMDLVEELMNGNERRVWEVADTADAFEDWPWILLYRRLHERFPAAKFVLTCRDERSWLGSYRAMLGREPANRSKIGDIRRFIYGFDVATASDETLLSRVRSHNEAVRAFFVDKRDRLLVVNWGAGDGWPELCSFLDRPVPSVDFPRENRRPQPSSLLGRALRRVVARAGEFRRR